MTAFFIIFFIMFIIGILFVRMAQAKKILFIPLILRNIAVLLTAKATKTN